MEIVELGIQNDHYCVGVQRLTVYYFKFFFRLACGIIARSSGLFQNTKKICACDGLTIWDERDRALVNHGTKSHAKSNEKICTLI